jgi:hypothetical protein
MMICVSDAKHQVLANLANFAYDPINYDFLWQLNIIDLFLGQISNCIDDLDYILHYQCN